MLGRNIRADECRTNPAKVVLISYELWQRRFGSQESVIGRTVELDREPFVIIGVMPPRFHFRDAVDLWRPERFRLDGHEALSRTSHYLHVYARLKPGISVATAHRELKAIAAQLAKDYPKTNTDVGALTVSLRDQFLGDSKLGLWVLLAGVGTLLLIACANVSGLLLARASARTKELAIRSALGATRGDLIRHTLAQSVLLALAGGALGVLLAVWTLPILNRLVPLTLAGWTHPQINAQVLLLTFAVSALAAIVSGLTPAWAASRTDINVALQQGGRAGIAAHGRVRSVLVGGEVGLAMLLIVGALLLTQTLWNLMNVPLGYRPEHVLTARTSIPLSPQSPYRTFEARTEFYRRVLERIAVIPGVQSVGYTTFLPLTNRGGSSGFDIEGQPAPKTADFNDANHRVVTPEYLQTIGDQLLRGRYFDSSDRVGSQPVAIVNESMARKYWPGEDALGKRFRLQEQNRPWVTIVGIVADVRQMGLDLEGRAEMYFPYTQEATSFGFYTPRDLAVRVTGDPQLFAQAIRKAVWEIDPHQPVIAVKPMQDFVDEELASRRLQVMLLCVFAGFALLLAALGLYGLLAFTVAQRNAEIGMRMALGADRGRILRETMIDGLRLVGGGLVAGSVVAWLLSHLVQKLLYGVAPGNVLTFGAAACLLLVTAVAASYFPARAAASVEPLEALRNS